MAQWKETRLEDKKNVIEAKLLDPELSLRDIEKETWIGKDTVWRILWELPELATTSDKWEIMINILDEIISDIAEITHKQLKGYKTKDELSIYDVKQLNEIAKTNFERKQLLTGKLTGNEIIIKIKE